jgi:proton-coupled amino acid transporter
VYIAALLLPLILLGFVPNLKYLAPISMIANIFMGIGLGITIYYLAQDIPDVSTRPHVNASLNTIPQFFSIVIFAMEAIGVVSTNSIIFIGLCNGASSCCGYVASNGRMACE